jgi:hypothetical protein
VLFTGSAAGGAMPRPIFPPELRAWCVSQISTKRQQKDTRLHEESKESWSVSLLVCLSICANETSIHGYKYLLQNKLCRLSVRFICAFHCSRCHDYWKTIP